MREGALRAAVHAALLAAIWIAAIAFYALAFTETRQPGWLAIDAVLVAGCLALVRARWHLVGFSSLGAQKAVRIGAIAALALATVALSQYVIVDRNGVWLDETNYLATAREGRILRDGLYPFNMRWLEPFLAGPWNVLPLDDAEALKAINFGALVVTAVLLALLLVRLGVRFPHALAAPVFLLCSYLGVYAATNRLVLDPFNYAMFAVMFHALLRREHAWLFGVALLVASFNSEKAVYWIPVFAVIELARAEDRTWRAWVAAAARTARYCGPAVAYLVAMRLYLLPSRTVSDLFVENVALMSFTWHDAGITNPTVKHNSFHVLWFPFGTFTVYALLGFTLAARAVKPVLLLLVPVMASVFIATDTERMLAYAFIVYLPLGYLYLARALADLPPRLGATLFGLAVVMVLVQHYLQPALAPLRDTYQLGLLGSRKLRLILSAAELPLVGLLVFVHHTFYRPDPAAPRDPPAPRS